MAEINIATSQKALAPVAADFESLARGGVTGFVTASGELAGYKAVDIDFQEALRIARAVASTPPLTLSGTAAGHIAGQAQSSAPPYPLKFHTPPQPSADGWSWMSNE